MTKDPTDQTEPTKTNNTFYVATAIAYVNDKPHIGHAMDFLYADVLARYHRQLGYDVLFSTGTDEHGGKIEEKAVAAGMPVQVFVDQVSAKFQTAIKGLGISYDKFVRTTDVGHVQRAQLIWNSLSDHIYKGQFEGWYCVGCEEYKTDTHVKETAGTCPQHNRAYEKLVEENYFFRLSTFGDQIRAAIESEDFRITPATRRNEILNLIKDGAKDISISRPKAKLSWGIPVPGDDDHVMYVWFEAVMNYITVLGYPEHADFAKFWPADVQVIGKDINRFHAVIWPGILLGLGLPLPKNLYVHGHIGSNGQKMSKTLGNVVDPLEIVEKYGLDAFRYYILRHVPSYEDGDFSIEKFEAAYNGELANELGNAVSRVAAMITRYQEGVIGEVREELHDDSEYKQAIADFRFDKAMELVWKSVQGLNKYLEIEKPWEIAKQDPDHLREVLAYAASSLLEIAARLQPFLPDASTKIHNTFESGVIRPLEASLFPRLEKPKPVDA